MPRTRSRKRRKPPSLSLLLQKLRVTRAEPREKIFPQANRQRSSRGSVRVGYESDPLVAREIPLLSDGLESIHGARVGADRLPQRLDHAVMMLIPRGTVADCGERSRRRLQRRIVGDAHSPVRAQTLGRAIREIALHDPEEIADLARAAAVGRQPAVPLPVRQAHPTLR